MHQVNNMQYTTEICPGEKTNKVVSYPPRFEQSIRDKQEEIAWLQCVKWSNQPHLGNIDLDTEQVKCQPKDGLF